ncbi:hypothetical protein B0H16DRAFT_1726889 [Mycena metata]|uniref:Uncharacterized protein n=1 Tax=Mycena metata TaxID=1033252 RepID=A0AAD7N4M6_9AGAR|nr:hypothetical protein B0H16DRAFT_1726889 [Mycena metata]
MRPGNTSPDPEKQAGGFESHGHSVGDKIETLNILDPNAPPSALDRTSFWGCSLALSAALERKVCALPCVSSLYSILHFDCTASGAFGLLARALALWSGLGGTAF